MPSDRSFPDIVGARVLNLTSHRGPGVDMELGYRGASVLPPDVDAALQNGPADIMAFLEDPDSPEATLLRNAGAEIHGERSLLLALGILGSGPIEVWKETTRVTDGSVDHLLPFPLATTPSTLKEHAREAGPLATLAGPFTAELASCLLEMEVDSVSDAIDETDGVMALRPGKPRVRGVVFASLALTQLDADSLADEIAHHPEPARAFVTRLHSERVIAAEDAGLDDDVDDVLDELYDNEWICDPHDDPEAYLITANPVLKDLPSFSADETDDAAYRAVAFGDMSLGFWRTPIKPGDDDCRLFLAAAWSTYLEDVGEDAEGTLEEVCIDIRKDGEWARWHRVGDLVRDGCLPTPRAGW